MNEDSDQLYQLFIWHAQGKRLVEKHCPNCGTMPHLEETVDRRKKYTCMQCECVTSDHTGKENDNGIQTTSS